MQQIQIRETSPVEPLYDTWTWNQDGGSWIINHPLSEVFHTVESLNHWYADSIKKTLNAFSELVRIWKIQISPGDRDDIGVINLEWQTGLSYQDYMDTVLQSVRGYLAPIYEVTIEVDICVYVRTHASPENPVQSWVRLPHNEFTITAKLDNPNAGLWFSVCHTLFGPGSRDYSPLTGPYPEPDEDFPTELDNNELQLLNQPLLEKALIKWEQEFGPVAETYGIPGVWEHGFLVEPY
jgi:hypothetical protein